MKRIVMAAGGAALLLAGAIGVSHAQTAPTTSTPTPAQQRHQAIISDAAAQLGLGADQLQQALAQARKDVAGGAHPLADLRQSGLQAAATTLGLADVKALRSELAGTTLTAVAQKHNVQPPAVSAAIMAAVNTRLQAEVAAGALTPAQVARLTQRAQVRVNALMTHQFPARKAP